MCGYGNIIQDFNTESINLSMAENEAESNVVEQIERSGPAERRVNILSK